MTHSQVSGAEPRFSQLLAGSLVLALAGCWLSFLRGPLFHPNSQISKLAVLLASLLPPSLCESAQPDCLAPGASAA